MKALKYIYTTVLFLSISAVLAQSTKGDTKEAALDTRKHGIGFTFGDFSGQGIAYRYRPSRWGAQVGIARDNKWIYENEKRKSAYLNIIYSIFKTNKTSFYVYESTCYTKAMATYAKYDSLKKIYVDQPKEKSFLQQSLGIGIELLLLKRFSLNAQYGLGYIPYVNGSEIRVNAEVLLFYTF